jgi:hypothetical protein
MVGPLAVSDEGERLTAAHQRAQRALTGDALSKLQVAWAEVDPEDAATWLRYVNTAEELCSSAQTASANTAFRYFERFRRAELKALGQLVDGLSVARPSLALPGEFEGVIEAYGPAYVRRLIASGVSVEEAKRLALSGQLGNLTGRILSPGRDVVSSGIDRDRRCIGYRRCCSGAACSFCAMLATRGAVYKEDSFRSGYKGQRVSLSTGKAKGARGAEVHRSCQCWMEPVYSRKSRPTANVTRYEALWRESGGDPLQFRRLVEGRS